MISVIHLNRILSIKKSAMVHTSYFGRPNLIRASNIVAQHLSRLIASVVELVLSNWFSERRLLFGNRVRSIIYHWKFNGVYLDSVKGSRYSYVEASHYFERIFAFDFNQYCFVWCSCVPYTVAFSFNPTWLIQFFHASFLMLVFKSVSISLTTFSGLETGLISF